MGTTLLCVQGVDRAWWLLGLAAVRQEQATRYPVLFRGSVELLLIQDPDFPSQALEARSGLSLGCGGICSLPLPHAVSRSIGRDATSEFSSVRGGFPKAPRSLQWSQQVSPCAATAQGLCLRHYASIGCALGSGARSAKGWFSSPLRPWLSRAHFLWPSTQGSEEFNSAVW